MVAGVFGAGLLYWGNRFKRYRRTTIIGYGVLGGAVLVVAGIVVNHLALSLPLVGLVAALAAAGGLFLLAGATPAALGLLADMSERFPSDRGAIMGLYSVFLALGQIIGSLIGGVAADWLGIDGMFIATLVLLGIAVVPLSQLADPGAPVRPGDRRGPRGRPGGLTGPSGRRCRAGRHRAILGRVTSNVGQNYPYSSETDADRSVTIATPPGEPRRTLRHARGRDDAARRERSLVGLEVPDEGLPGPAPRRRLRARQARRVRRVRRDLRQDLPALRSAAPTQTDGTVACRVEPPTLRGSRRRLDRHRRHRRSRRGLRVRLRAGSAGGRLLRSSRRSR